jgi:hypothetical protein
VKDWCKRHQPKAFNSKELGELIRHLNEGEVAVQEGLKIEEKSKLEVN